VRGRVQRRRQDEPLHGPPRRPALPHSQLAGLPHAGTSLLYHTNVLALSPSSSSVLTRWPRRQSQVRCAGSCLLGSVDDLARQPAYHLSSGPVPPCLPPHVLLSRRVSFDFSFRLCRLSPSGVGPGPAGWRSSVEID
jgi:hypothetical protein